MDSSSQRISPLRQRMIDDMRMRKLEHKTQEGYIRAVCKLAAFLRRSPDSATIEDLRRFQLPDRAPVVDAQDFTTVKAYGVQRCLGELPNGWLRVVSRFK